MKTLTVSLNYSTSAFAPYQRGSIIGVALPVRVLDREGAVIAESLVTSNYPASFSLPNELQVAFVRLTWPSGRSEIQSVDLESLEIAQVTFSDSNIARNEWSAWAIPRLNPRTSLANSERPRSISNSFSENIWLRLWRFEMGEWLPVSMSSRMQYKSDVVRQVDLELGPYFHLIQVGGPSVPWRFVALPSGGPCRVLITPNESKDPRADPLKIVVTGFRADAETLLEFLSRDALRAANTIANFPEIAVALFEGKFEDPIAAVAGAYYLLRIDDWERVPIWWWQNLSSNFPWVPDTAIVHCVRLLREGLKDQRARSDAVELFKSCLDRGWPVYEEGLRLVSEAASLLRNVTERSEAEYFSQVEGLVAAKSWAGAALSFYGKEPFKPSAVLWVGMPYAPRRHRLPQTEWVESLAVENMSVVADAETESASGVSRQLSSLTYAKDLAPQRAKKAILSAQTVGGQQKREIAEMSMEESYEGDHGEIRRSRPRSSRKNKKEGNWMLLSDIGDNGPSSTNG